MGWERRKSSSERYYTRSRRVNGRVRREYIGRGQAAELLAEMDRLRRQARAIERAIAVEERAEREAFYARLFGPLDVLEAASGALVRQTLMAAGFRQHNRGEWRRPHGGKA